MKKSSIQKTRDALTKARKRYIRDMKWLRKNFGIIYEPESSVVKEALLAALDAVEKNDLPSLQQTVDSFEALHKSIMRQVSWGMLEQTKRMLKKLKNESPMIYEEKLELWNQASWAYTNGVGFGGNPDKCREAIKLLVKI